MRAVWVSAVFVAVMVAVPVAAADAPTIKVTVESEVPSVQIKPGGRAVVNLTVMVEFIDYTCTAGTKVGVDLVPPVAGPDWFGAEPHPDGDTYGQPKETKSATLTIVVDQDAPGDAEGVHRLQPVVKLPAPQSCGGMEPQVEAPEFSIRVSTPPAPTSPTVGSSPGDPDAGNGVPGPGALSMLLLGLGAWLFRHRRK